jgi:hypothetical protein
MLKRFPFHTLLFAIYPVIALYGHNITEVTPDGVVRPFFVAIAGTLFLFVAMRLLFRNTLKAGLLVTFFLLLFFTYGQVYNLLKESSLVAAGLARHRYLIFIYAGLFILGLIALFRGSKHYTNINLTLNFVGLILLVFPVYQITSYLMINPVGQNAAAKVTARMPLSRRSNLADQPDVYYIILDGYSRADVIQRELGFDNTYFLDQLRNLGFIIPQCSRSNYRHTQPSLTSSLNMELLPTIHQWAAEQGVPAEDVLSLLTQSQVRKEFESLGYKIVAFYNIFPWLRLTDADLYISPTTTPFGVKSITPFEKIVLDTTLVSVYLDWQNQNYNNKFTEVDHPESYFIHQEKFKLVELPKIAKIVGPTFTYAHILIPHYPFVFSPNAILTDPGFYSGAGGSPINDHYFKVGYVDEIQFANQQMISILTQILKDSSTPPIIILQGDHGFGDDRFPILNAYYLPGEGSKKIYPTISPVNTFRIIFNTYFGGSYSLLPDISYKDNESLNPVPELDAPCK